MFSTNRSSAIMQLLALGGVVRPKLSTLFDIVLRGSPSQGAAIKKFSNYTRADDDDETEQTEKE